MIFAVVIIIFINEKLKYLLDYRIVCIILNNVFNS